MKKEYYGNKFINNLEILFAYVLPMLIVVIAVCYCLYSLAFAKIIPFWLFWLFSIFLFIGWLVAFLYFCFQIIIIDDYGIQIILFKKILFKCSWKEIKYIEVWRFNRSNRYFRALLVNEKSYVFDRRKKSLKLLIFILNAEFFLKILRLRVLNLFE